MGSIEGLRVGDCVGSFEGAAVAAEGAKVGLWVGSSVGRFEGATVGGREGKRVGGREGSVVGARDGKRVGNVEGARVGGREGRREGAREGTGVGPGVGDGVGHSTGRVAGSHFTPLATAAACSSTLHTLPTMTWSQHTGFSCTPLLSQTVLQFKTVLALLLRSGRGN